MTTKTAITVTIRAERIGYHIYPVGSDTPIPRFAIMSPEVDPHHDLPPRTELQVGDVVLDTFGRAFVIDQREDIWGDGGTITHAFQADSLRDVDIDELTAPITLLARCGEPISDVMYR